MLMKYNYLGEEFKSDNLKENKDNSKKNIDERN